MVGHPEIHAHNLAALLNDLNPGGVRFMPWTFRPSSGRWADQRCHGVRILVLDPARFNPGLVQLELCRILVEETQIGADLFTCPSQRISMFDHAMGSDRPEWPYRAGRA